MNTLEPFFNKFWREPRAFRVAAVMTQIAITNEVPHNQFQVDYEDPELKTCTEYFDDGDVPVVDLDEDS